MPVPKPSTLNREVRGIYRGFKQLFGGSCPLMWVTIIDSLLMLPLVNTHDPSSLCSQVDIECPF